MRASRVHFTFSACIVAAFSLTLFITLAGFFRSVEKNSSTGTGENRIVSQLKSFQDQLRLADDAEAVKHAFKSFDLSSGFGPESEVGKELRKAYAPTIAVFANKPREAEPKYLLGKKRELMETLVNSYRKEIPRGDIRIRAIYLNVLFDTQNSLISENDETEEVYIRRNKERIASLKGLIVGAPDPTLAGRVSAIESLFASYEKAFNQSSEWRRQKLETLDRADKSIPKTAHQLYLAQDQGSEDFRRSFLYACVLALLVACGSVVALLIAHKLARLQFETKSGALVAYLKEFARDRTDPQSQKAIEILEGDQDWATIYRKTKQSEETLVEEFQSHLALSKSLRLPYIIFTKDRVARLWNDEAANLFGIEAGSAPSVDDVIRDGKISVREGDAGILAETIRASFAVPQVDSYEFLVGEGDQAVHVELVSCPIVTGRAAGGKVYCFREIRNEAERIDRAVSVQMDRVRAFVQKVAHFYPAELVSGEKDSPAVREMTSDLNNMKRKIDERELLWKSETGALVDQVERQKEILLRLSTELEAIRKSHQQALEIVRGVHTTDENFVTEVEMMERDVQRWRANRSHLLTGISNYETLIANATLFESEIRVANENMTKFLEQYAQVQKSLKDFAEEAKVKAVNLGLTSDSSQWEYADRARTYADSLQQFVGKTSELVTKVGEFLKKHPAGALAPVLAGKKFETNLIGTIKEEQDRLAEFFQRWKESGETLVDGGEQALGILQTAEKNGAVAAQLNETILLINEQAKGNLSRWN